jgi:uncharacterized protein (DUF2267 family)
MRTTRRLLRFVGLVAGAIGVVAVTAPDTPVARAARRLGNRLARDVRYAAASSPGVVYRLMGRHPDPNVTDDVLADRIRSTLGPLEKRLDAPRVRVAVDDHVAILHGNLPDDRAATTIERAVMRISGVDGIESHLHVGLRRGDTRPSEGATVAVPSGALEALLDAAQSAGATQPHDAVHAVLCGFADRIPDDERAQMFGQLPADVRALAAPPRRDGVRPPRVKTLPQLVGAVIAEGGIEPARAEAITRAVVTTLRTLVPHEAHDVSSVLPIELRELWEARTAS